MGFFSNLDLEGYDREYSDRQLMSRMAELFQPYRRSMVYITILVLIIAFAGAAQPVLVSRGVDLLDTGISTYLIVLLALASRCPVIGLGIK